MLWEWESQFLGRLIRSSASPRRKKGSGALEVKIRFSSIQFSRSVVSDSLRPHELQHTRPPCPSRVHSDSRPSSRWCHPAISSSVVPFSCPQCLPACLFNESTLRMRWPKYWSFSFSISPSKEISGLICIMDWLDLLAVHGTLKNLLKCHSSKASILWRSAFFTVQLSHPYLTAGKTIVLTRQTLVGRVMSGILKEEFFSSAVLSLS